jgi:MFS family permease
MSLTPSLAVFRHRAYAQYWVMRIFGGAAMQMLAVAIGWQVYDIARQTRSVEQSALILGLVGLAQFLPLLLFSLVGGVAADRLDRKAILVVTYLIRVCVVLGLLAVSGAGASDAVLPAIFAAAVVLGGLNAFFPAAASALLPRLVPRDELPQAIAWSSLAFQSAAIMGPAVGGLIYVGGARAVYATCIGLLVAAAFLIQFAPTPRHERVAGARTFSMILEGLRYVRDNKIVLGAISLDLVVVLFGGAMALLPVFARDILHVGPSGLGLLRAAPALGAACVAIILATRPKSGWLAISVGGLLALAAALPTVAQQLVAAGWQVGQALGAAGDALGPPTLGPGLVELFHVVPLAAAMSVAVSLGTRPFEGTVGRWMLVAVAIFGVATLAIAFSPWFWLTLAALAVRGASDMVSVYIRQSLIQLATPDVMRGRVSSVSYIFISASNELGEFEAGVAARLIGPINAVILGGVVAVGSALAWPKLFPKLAQTKRFEDAAVDDTRPPPEPLPTPAEEVDSRSGALL